MSIVRFKKNEINQIMEIYSKKISTGEWKDYSISFQKNYAIFSIHKSFKLEPYYQIEKKYIKRKTFTLIHRSSIVIYSDKLNKVINYLSKPNLRLVR